MASFRYTSSQLCLPVVQDGLLPFDFLTVMFTRKASCYHMVSKVTQDSLPFFVSRWSMLASMPSRHCGRSTPGTPRHCHRAPCHPDIVTERLARCAVIFPDVPYSHVAWQDTQIVSFKAYKRYPSQPAVIFPEAPYSHIAWQDTHIL